LGFLAVSLLFGSVAGACAFLITFNEYQHHFQDSRRTWKISLEAGLFAFLFFAGLSLVVFVFLPRAF